MKMVLEGRENTYSSSKDVFVMNYAESEVTPEIRFANYVHSLCWRELSALFYFFSSSHISYIYIYIYRYEYYHQTCTTPVYYNYQSSYVDMSTSTIE